MIDEILDPEIAAARERVAAAEAKAKARREADARAAKLREELDAAALAEAVAEHGELGDGVAKVATGLGLVIVRRPTSSRWRRAEKELATKNEAKLEEAAKALILDHLVLPRVDDEGERSRYFAIVDRYPALPHTLIQQIAGLAFGGAKAAGE